MRPIHVKLASSRLLGPRRSDKMHLLDNLSTQLAASRQRRRGFNSDMVELFLWLTVMAGLGYVALPQLSSLPFFNSNPTPSSSSTDENVVDNDLVMDKPKTSPFSIQLTVQLYEQEVVADGEGNSTKSESQQPQMWVSKILADDNSKRFVVPKKYRFVELQPESSSRNYGNRTNSTKEQTNRQMIKLVCSAPFPLQFKYEGAADPRFKINVEKRPSTEDSPYIKLSMYILTLSFQSDLPRESESGRYTCKAVDSGHSSDGFPFDQYDTENDEKSPKHMDIFVPGEMKLLHGSHLNPDDRSGGGYANGGDHDDDDGSGAKSHHRSAGSQGANFTKSVIILHHNVAVDGKEITLPCGASDPAARVWLYIKTSDGFESRLNEAVSGSISYDYVNGFKVPVLIVKNMLRRFHQPKFVCRTSHKRDVREISFHVLLTDGSDSQFTPKDNVVIMMTPSSPSAKSNITSQLFECEAEEPITIKWKGKATTTTELNQNSSETKLPNQTIMYKASLIASQHQFHDDMTQFQCVRNQSGVIIHTWTWSRKGVTKPKLVYNGEEKKLSCCMNRTVSSSSVHAPQLLVKTCSTMLECQVKASFQPKIASAVGSRGKGELTKSRAYGADGDADDDDGHDKTCQTWTLPTDFRAGLVMCSEVRTDSSSSREMQNYNHAHPSPNNYSGYPPVFVNWNDDVVIIRNNGLDASLSQLKRLTTIRTVKGGTSSAEEDPTNHHDRYIYIECSASSLLFAKGFRWTMHMQSGKIIRNVQRETTWEGEKGILSYQEDLDQESYRIRGVLQIKIKEYTKPFLAISRQDDENSSNSSSQSGFAHLKMEVNIGIVKCEIPLWNDTNIWVGNFIDV